MSRPVTELTFRSANFGIVHRILKVNAAQPDYFDYQIPTPMNSIHTTSDTDPECPRVSSTSSNDASPAHSPAGRGWLMLFDGAGALVVLAAAGLWVCRAFAPDAPNPHAGTSTPSAPAPVVTPAVQSPSSEELPPALPSPNFVSVKNHPENTVAIRARR